MRLIGRVRRIKLANAAVRKVREQIRETERRNKLGAHERIRLGMRDNERNLLSHLRKYRVTNTDFFGMGWHNAFGRLMDAKKIEFRSGRYRAVRGARPVTFVRKAACKRRWSGGGSQVPYVCTLVKGHAGPHRA